MNNPNDPTTVVLRYVDGFNNADVVPAPMTVDLQGKRATQTGSIFTVALGKIETQWQLTAWAWPKGAPDPGCSTTILRDRRADGNSA